jgi:hypothetical protein
LETLMELPSLTSVTKASISIASLFLTAASLIVAYTIWFEKRNADLVQIGVNVLRVDPDKEKELSAATREWALDLIDANAGGVRFSQEARAQLLREPFGYSYGSYYDTSSPLEPAPRRPSAQPQK